jgi:hypothetical protein
MKTAKTAKVGRPRVRPLNETVPLSIKIDPDLMRALDTEVEAANVGLPLGRARVSRGELIRMALHEWIATRKAGRK